MKDCIVCDTDKTHPLFKGIVKCQGCGHVSADTSLTDEELSKLYSREYFFGEEYSNYLADRKVLEKNFQLRIKVLKRFLQEGRHRNLLEIGCAYGFFLHLATDLFNSVKGIDLNEDGIEYARKEFGAEAVRGDFVNYDFGDEKFDAVCLWDTIEHLRDPHLYLEKISRHTEKNSLLAITTGDIGSVNARMRKEKWRLIHPPTHLHYFSKKSLTDLLNKYGFDVVYMRYCGFYRSVDNIAYNLFVLRNGWKALYSMLKKSGATSWHLYANMFDIMYVVARKR